MILTIFGISIVGCNDPVIFMNDSERGVWESQQREKERPPERGRSLISVEGLTYEFEVCIQMEGYSPLSMEMIQSISERSDKGIQNKVSELSQECSEISKVLFEKLEAARDSGYSQDKIYQAMLVGKSEAQEDIRLDY